MPCASDSFGNLRFIVFLDGLPEVFTIMAIMLLFLAPLPCLVMSVVALVLAISNNSDGYKSFAITDIVASVIWLGFSALSFVRVMSI